MVPTIPLFHVYSVLDYYHANYTFHVLRSSEINVFYSIYFIFCKNDCFLAVLCALFLKFTKSAKLTIRYFKNNLMLE